MLRPKARYLPVLVALATSGVVAWAALRPFDRPQPHGTWKQLEKPSVIWHVNRIIEARWTAVGIQPAAATDDLQILRRLSLALVGTVPSLEEIREFENDSSPERLDRWTARLIDDWRFVEFFGDRLATALVNDADNEFRDNHRQRFVEWLGRAIQQGQPYDMMVRSMIAESGFGTDDAAVFFIGSELIKQGLAPQRLAARSARAFLGQQIGCAQCHDHPFADWKQRQFEELAAHFGQLRLTSLGIQDEPSADFTIGDERQLENRTVEPGVPFDERHLPGDGTRRERLAAWVTHRENRRFRRATVNRVWGLMFGRPYVLPVDDIPNPPLRGKPDDTELLDVLGDDWAAHCYDLRRLIRVIALSRPFRLASEHPSLGSESPGEFEFIELPWVTFPMTQLTPKQLMQSLQQAASIKTVRIREEATTHTYLWNRELMRQATERYGASGDWNDTHQTGSIPQAVMRLVGPDIRNAVEANLASAAGRISLMSADSSECLDACYLVCLTRRPVDEERAHFTPQLDTARSGPRRQIVEDLFWTLLNSPEFNWNH